MALKFGSKTTSLTPTKATEVLQGYRVYVTLLFILVICVHMYGSTGVYLGMCGYEGPKERRQIVSPVHCVCLSLLFFA